MRWLLLIVLNCSLWSYGQIEITSFYIQELPELSSNYSDSIPTEYRGVFAQEVDSSKQIVIDKDSIVFSKVLTSFLTLDQVKDKSEWYLSEGRLYGVKKDLGLVYIEEDDTIYFNLPLSYTKYNQFQQDTYKIDFIDANTIVMYEKADRGWMINSLLVLDGKGLKLCPFDHDYTVDKIENWKNVNEKSIDGYRTFIAKPSSAELLDILNDKRAFAHTISYTKLID